MSAEAPKNEPLPEIVEDLVAYLDQELDGAKARAVEVKLSLDPSVRAEADSLKRTWALLDYLPKKEPSATFTTRTLQRLEPIKAVKADRSGSRPSIAPVSEPSRSSSQAGVPIAVVPPRRLSWILVPVLFCFAGTAGFVGRLLWTQPPPTIAPRSGPYFFADPGFLALIDQSDLFEDEMPGIAPKAPDRAVKLQAVLLRWYDKLSDAERAQVTAGQSLVDHVEAIRRLRQAEWLAGQPAPRRQEYAEAAPERKARLLEEWREEERNRNEVWQVVESRWEEFKKYPLPVPMYDEAFRKAVLVHVDTVIRPLLTPTETMRLDYSARQGVEQMNWLPYARLVAELAERYRLVRGLAPDWRTINHLPDDIRKAIRQDKFGDTLKNKEIGRYPDFVLNLNKLAREGKIKLPRPLGPTRLEELPISVQDFLKRELFPRIRGTPDWHVYQTALEKGLWPEYPETILDLATKHNLSIPGVMLPGEPERWELLRPKRKL